MGLLDLPYIRSETATIGEEEEEEEQRERERGGGEANEKE